MEEFLLQLRHGLAVLKQLLEADGLVLLRPDGVQLEGCQPEGQTPGLCLIHRRAV